MVIRKKSVGAEVSMGVMEGTVGVVPVVVVLRGDKHVGSRMKWDR